VIPGGTGPAPDSPEAADRSRVVGDRGAGTVGHVTRVPPGAAVAYLAVEAGVVGGTLRDEEARS